METPLPHIQTLPNLFSSFAPARQKCRNTSGSLLGSAFIPLIRSMIQIFNLVLKSDSNCSCLSLKFS